MGAMHYFTSLSHFVLFLVHIGIFIKSQLSHEQVTHCRITQQV